LKLGYLFLIRGLILLAAAALLLIPLTGFVRHLVGLAGLVTLLRWIRLILLCHVSSPGYQRRFFLRVQRLLIDIGLARRRPGCPRLAQADTAQKHSNSLPQRKQKA
jgi:UPF0716 family protein affecting phage T7 exclusion